MANNLPESQIPDVRDYIYVDEARVQSLLAQLGGGVLVERETTDSRSGRVKLGLKAMGWERGNEASESERISTADLHVSSLEDDATALGMLIDLSDLVTKEKFWKRGKVRRSIEPGMLIRVTAPTQLIDPRSISNAMREFLVAFGDDDNESRELGELLDMADALYGHSMSLSVRPTVTRDASCAFLGLIPHSHSFGPLQRDLLFSRIGPDIPQLTSIMQVARVPTAEESLDDALKRVVDVANRITKVSGDSLHRELFDDLMVRMGHVLEAGGMQDAPRWPAIAVVPLAIYRSVLPSPNIDPSEYQDDEEPSESREPDEG